MGYDNPPPDARVQEAVRLARAWEKSNHGDDLSDLICNESVDIEDEDCDDTAIWAYAHGLLAPTPETERLRSALWGFHEATRYAETETQHDSNAINAAWIVARGLLAGDARAQSCPCKMCRK